MTLSTIGVGTTANDGTGDPLRTAFQTVNTAITAVNNAVVVGTGVTTFKDDSGTYGVAVASDGDVTFTNAGATVGMTWDASANGNAGSMGINTPTPANTLHVAGSGRIDSTLAVYDILDLYRAGTNYVRSRTAGATMSIGVTTGAGALYYPISVSAASDQTTLSNSTGTQAVFKSNNDISLYNAGTTVGMTWDASANSNAGGLGIGTTAPTEQLDLSGDAIRIRTAQTPASAAATGDAGMVCWDASYIYVCTATNTWKRTAIATW